MTKPSPSARTAPPGGSEDSSSEGARSTEQKMVVFAGARAGADARHAENASLLGYELSRDGWTIVTGGGGVGLMNAVVEGAKGVGGKTEGVVPAFLNSLQPSRQDLDCLRTVDDIFERKRIMLTEASAAIALPGGMGTLDEIGDFSVLGQVEQHRKPLFFLDTDGYWDHLFQMFEHMVEEKFLDSLSSDLVVRVADVEELMEKLRRLFPPKQIQAVS